MIPHRISLAFMAVLLISSCASVKKAEQSYIVTEFGTDNDEPSFCKDFRLNKSQVSLFFSLVTKVNRQIIHDQYDYLPCYVRGLTQNGNSPACHWEIRAGSTGSITCANETTYYVCDQCNF